MLSKPTWLLGITGPCWGDIAVAMMAWVGDSLILCINEQPDLEYHKVKFWLAVIE